MLVFERSGDAINVLNEFASSNNTYDKHPSQFDYRRLPGVRVLATCPLYIDFTFNWLTLFQMRRGGVVQPIKTRPRRRLPRRFCYG